MVHHAREEGIDLKIVLLDHNPPNDTPLRDISTVVGADYPDATVLTLSPSYVGSYSTHFPGSRWRPVKITRKPATRCNRRRTSSTN